MTAKQAAEAFANFAEYNFEDEGKTGTAEVVEIKDGFKVIVTCTSGPITPDIHQILADESESIHWLSRATTSTPNSRTYVFPYIRY